MADLQELFDRSVKGVLEQGRPAFNTDGGGCKYRTIDGAKCAVGQLIPDEAYVDQMEGSRVDNPSSPRAVLVREAVGITPNGEAVKLLGQLQSAHDEAAWSGSHFPYNFRRLATDVADKFNLNKDVLA